MDTDRPLAYADPVGDTAVANVMQEEHARDSFPGPWAESALAMLTDDTATNDDITYLLLTIAPGFAA